MKKSYTYILTNTTHTVLYAGVTSDLHRRLAEHANGLSSFTSRYKVHKLVYFEEHPNIAAAIAREKQWKSWSRKKKMELIDSGNPSWKNLSE
ncbi:MAG: GIY-YIG nuclease family protein [Alistipes sp.]|nr:GIY-YIG nuclease family protein [Alistipes sp.]